MRYTKTTWFLQWIFLLPFLFVPVLEVYAVPPAPGNQDKIVRGDPVTLTWKHSKQNPDRVIWMQPESIHEFFRVDQDENSIQVPRKGVNKLPTELLVIPERDNLRPRILEIKKDQTSVTFQSKPISEDEIWFWGRTPDVLCHRPNGDGLLAVNVRRMKETSEQRKFEGGFLWHITEEGKSKATGSPIVNFSSNMLGREGIKSVSSRGINPVKFKKCPDHFENCRFVFSMPPQKWGGHHRIRIEPKSKSDFPTDFRCPQY